MYYIPHIAVIVCTTSVAVIVLTVSGDTVRRFMLAAKELGYINGEYVFMDVELFPFKGEKLMVHSLQKINVLKKQRITHPPLLLL